MNKKIKWVLLIILLLLVGCFFASKYYAFSKGTEILKEVNDDSDLTQPWYTVIPQKISISNASKNYVPNSTKAFTYKNISFRIPDINFEEAKIENTDESFSIFSGDVGKFMVLPNVSHNLQDILDQDNILKPILEENNITDQFSFKKFVYSKIPNDISFFDSNNEIIATYSFLKLKSAFLVTGGEKYLGYFEDDDLRGFQYCKPELCDVVLSEIFLPSNDSLLLRFSFFNQNEIDYVLSSINVVE